jgi:hypothetical protein
LQLNVNGENRGFIRQSETVLLKIPNGYHVINAINPYYPVENGSFAFNINNERIEISILSNNLQTSEFQIRNRVLLSRSQSVGSLRNSAINASFNALSPYIPNGAKIAVLSIAPASADTAFIQEELTLLFVNSQKYVVVDRQSLDAVRNEQRFQMSGEVSDETAVSIGHFLGADVVIVGSVSGNVPQRRLRLRAINIQTAQIIAMSSEEI